MLHESPTDCASLQMQMIKFNSTLKPLNYLELYKFYPIYPHIILTWLDNSQIR